MMKLIKTIIMIEADDSVSEKELDWWFSGMAEVASDPPEIRYQPQGSYWKELGKHERHS